MQRMRSLSKGRKGNGEGLPHVVLPASSMHLPGVPEQEVGRLTISS